MIDNGTILISIVFFFAIYIILRLGIPLIVKSYRRGYIILTGYYGRRHVITKGKKPDYDKEEILRLPFLNTYFIHHPLIFWFNFFIASLFIFGLLILCVYFLIYFLFFENLNIIFII